MEIRSTPIQEIHEPKLEQKGVRLLIKREDLNHPIISGNKLRKLKYHLESARSQGYDKLLSFGGAFSNHIYALAGAGKEYGFKTIGIIRGEERLPLNPTLTFAKSCGMELHYMDRETYRQKEQPAFIASLKEQHGHFFHIPEGGSGKLGIQGCTEIVQDIQVPFDYLCCPVGTGGTLSGLIAGLDGQQKVIGFSALKGNFLEKEVNAMLSGYRRDLPNNWKINAEYHFGGYAKIKPPLLEFMARFEQKHQIPLDPVYTAKMLFGIFDLIEKDHFAPGSVVMALHTGGLQGRAGFGL